MHCHFLFLFIVCSHVANPSNSHIFIMRVSVFDVIWPFTGLSISISDFEIASKSDVYVWSNLICCQFNKLLDKMPYRKKMPNARDAYVNADSNVDVIIPYGGDEQNKKTKKQKRRMKQFRVSEGINVGPHMWYSYTWLGRCAVGLAMHCTQFNYN